MHPVLKRVLGARGITCQEDCQYRLNRLLDMQQLKGVDRAAEIVLDAIARDAHIKIVGDYDADGATGSALLLKGLRMFGASRISVSVPNRFEFGYGLSAPLFESFAHDAPDLLITVDNGISSIDGVAAAKAAGVQVVITDHHLAGDELPDADAIVNPNVAGDPFPSKNLAGVGVAFYLMAAVRAKLREQGSARARQSLDQLLPLVALGTIADLVPLDFNNRVLVAQGLARIRKHANPGIRALLEVGGRDPSRATANDLAFTVAPRLNAAGRMEDMSQGIQCLAAESLGEATPIAARLDQLNTERKSVQGQMQEDATELLAEADGLSDFAAKPSAMTLFSAAWHEGVVGLLASKLKEMHHRPVAAFAPSAVNETLLKGSVRSINGFHARDALAEVQRRAEGIIHTFGGHAMAAGLSMDAKHIETFERVWAEVAGEWLEPEQLESIVWTDGNLAASEFSVELAKTIASAGPWGQKFPEPLFDGKFEILEKRIVGQQHLKMEVVPHDGHRSIDAIAFFHGPDVLEAIASEVQLVFSLDVNYFRGRQTPQLLVRHIL